MHGETAVHFDCKKSSDMIKIKFIILMIGLLLIGQSCVISRPNYREYFRDNIKAGGSILRNGQAQYYSFTVGSPLKPLNQSLEFSIRFRSGVTLQSSKFSHDVIKPIAILKNDLPESDVWGASASKYIIEGYSFLFSNGNCVVFSASVVHFPNETFIPEIGTADMKEFYKMPLPQQIMENLFGPPDRIIDRLVL